MNDKLLCIQKELKIPKNEFNEFAGYTFRSAEGILEAVKPLVHDQGLTIVLNDEVLTIGNSNYTKATVTLSDGKEHISTSAYAREEGHLKGQISAQISGGASSYARKYALGGLFAIDDNKDVDSQDNREQPTKSKPNTEVIRQASDKQRALIKTKLNEIGVTDEDSGGYLIEQYGVTLPLNSEQASFVIGELL